MLKHLAEFAIIHSIWKKFSKVPKATLMSLIIKNPQKLVVHISSRNSLERLIKNISSWCPVQDISRLQRFSYKWLKSPTEIYHCLPKLSFFNNCTYIHAPTHTPPIHTPPIDTPLYTYNVYNSIYTVLVHILDILFYISYIYKHI